VNAKQQAKVVWFKLRTGCSETEAEEWLKKAKFKLEVAIRLRNAHYAAIHRNL
jgi:hypothetical protein